jgi:hypothetical protein
MTDPFTLVSGATNQPSHAAPTELGLQREPRFYKHGAPNGACDPELVGFTMALEEANGRDIASRVRHTRLPVSAL